ncbi:MAG: secretin N-terminal domain-containing protein [Chlamydiota bacterium]
MKKLRPYFLSFVIKTVAVTLTVATMTTLSSSYLEGSITTHIHPSDSSHPSQVLFSLEDETIDEVHGSQPSKTKESNKEHSALDDIGWDGATTYQDPRIFNDHGSISSKIGNSQSSRSSDHSRDKKSTTAATAVNIQAKETQPAQQFKTLEDSRWHQQYETSLQSISDPLIPRDLSKEKEPIAMSMPETSVSLDHTIAQIDSQDTNQSDPDQNTILINFNNVNIIELIRFISKVSERNFYFNEEELDFQVTIISEEPTTIENVLMALMQELRIHNFEMMEQGDDIIIHSNANVQAPGVIRAESLPETMVQDADIVTQVFRLNTANATNVASMIQSMLSSNAIIEVLEETNHIILTDIDANVEKIATLIKSIDAPNSSLIIGQYVVRNAFMTTLLQNAELIMQSIAPGQSITFIPHTPSNSIFIVSTPFLVERAIPILQRLDQTDGLTGIYNLDELRYVPPELMRPGDVIGPGGVRAPDGTREMIEIGPDGKIRLVPGQAGAGLPSQKGRWRLDSNGNWIYEPDEDLIRAVQEAQGLIQRGGSIDTSRPPDGYWRQDPSGNWEFVPGAPPVGYSPERGPKGYWELGPDGKWRYSLTPGESIFAGKKTYFGRPDEGLPFGSIERTKFLIYKLNYRLGDTIETAMLKMADSMRESDAVNQSLIATINSVQWLEPSNSLIFTGTPESLIKVKELVEELDQPLRQVFIEMLILETSVDDSLNYQVNWGDRFRNNGGDLAGAQAFQGEASPVSAVLDSAGAPGITGGTNLTSSFPDTRPIIANQPGYAAGIIGQSICAGGIEFSTLGAFVRAVHQKSDVNIVMNPKIITEDNVTAEIFVGLNTRFQTQAISNDEGSIVTNNFEFRDVGTTLRVTPLLGPSNIITLQIEEEVSNIASVGQGTGVADINPGPTTRINRTTTQVHIPNKYFLVISGMIQDQIERTRNQIPCLGGAPLIGAAFTGKTYRDEKRCLMIFIRPMLVDTEEQIDDITKHQQNIFRLKRRTKKMWKLDCEEALDWMNLKETDSVNDERRCCDFKY